MFGTINQILLQFWIRFINYIPDFFAGTVILVCGILLSTLLKKLVRSLYSFFRVSILLHRAKLIAQNEAHLWAEILSELIKWTVILFFLIPTLDSWGLSKASAVVNQFLLYIPNVIIATVIGFVGVILSNLASHIFSQSVNNIGKSSTKTLSVFIKGTVLLFTLLVVLNQIGVAQDLIRIFFTGVVAMIALAGGLSFGLGGKDLAREILDSIKKKLS